MKKLCLLLCLLWPSFAAADTPLTNAAQELRAKALFHELRCMVCEGQSLADSHAQMAIQMRQLIRSQITQGMSDDAILDFFVQRYGNEVRMTPPLQASTWLLWLAPLLFLLGGSFWLWRLQRQS